MDVAAADAALTRALHAGVEHLSYDQSDRPARPAAGADRQGRGADPGAGRAVDADGSYALDGALSAGAWLGVARQTPGQAARTVRTARTLRSGALPNTTAALAAGASPGGTPR